MFVSEQTAGEKLTLKISIYVEEKKYRLRKFFVYTRWAFIGCLRKKQNVIYSKVLYTQIKIYVLLKIQDTQKVLLISYNMHSWYNLWASEPPLRCNS